ncbi:hypothetical protein GLYMA_20G011551v4 [Glycine max]|nr:hypothetical protein GLYMA_20G011551v4 [Glycine max]KAH1034011.1 hypothetical protein GYH30_054428 [Glycine max]
MFVAFVLVLFAEVAPKDMDENFHANDVGVVDTNVVDEIKYGYGSWRTGAALSS